MTLDEILLKYVLKDKVENLLDFKTHNFNQYQSSEEQIQSQLDKYVIYADAIHQYLEMCENAKDEQGTIHFSFSQTQLAGFEMSFKSNGISKLTSLPMLNYLSSMYEDLIEKVQDIYELDWA